MLVNKSKSIRVQVQKRRTNVSEMAQRTRNSWAYCPESINHTYNNVNSVVKMRQSTWKDTSHTCVCVCVPIYISTCVCMYLYVYHLVPVLPTDWRKYWQQRPRNLKRTNHNKSRLWSSAGRGKTSGGKRKGRRDVCVCVCVCAAEMLVKLKHFTCPDVDKLEVFEVWNLPFAMSCLQHLLPPPPSFSCDTFALPTYYTQESICGAKFYNEANAPADYRLNK